MKNFQIVVKGNTIRYIYDDVLSSLGEQGEARTARASFVEPMGSEWWADLFLSGGPKLGPFKLREEALAAEMNWLIRNNIPIPHSEDFKLQGGGT